MSEYEDRDAKKNFFAGFAIGIIAATLCETVALISLQIRADTKNSERAVRMAIPFVRYVEEDKNLSVRDKARQIADMEAWLKEYGLKLE